MRTEAADILVQNDSLKALEKLDPRKARMVELRFFGCLSIEETAEALGVSPITVTRDWQVARAWLSRRMSPTAAGTSSQADNA